MSATESTLETAVPAPPRGPAAPSVAVRHPDRRSRSATPKRHYRRASDGLSAASARPKVERAVDVTIAVLALVILAPVIVLIAIAVRLDSKGPIFYRQLRIGLDRRGQRPGDDDAVSRRTADLGGRPFTIYKFRSMRLDAEAATGPVWASPDDDRVTRVGRVLRRYRLDEIPQLWNVVRGDMSIVGPRPERPLFVSRLREEVEGYPLRHRVRPGITGWAQVNQGPDRTVEDVRGKLELDLEYLERRSLAFDFRIMLQTIPVMIQRFRDTGRAS